LNEKDNLNVIRLPVIALNMNTNPLCWFWFPKWRRQYRLGIKITASRLRSSVLLHVVRYLPGTERSPVLMRSWSMPDRQGLYTRYARPASGFLKTPRLWTKYAIRSLQLSALCSITISCR
jgi:hypothetical protein